MSVIRSLSEGLRFSISLRRIIPYLIIDLIIFYVLIDFFGKVLSLVLNRISAMSFLLSLGIYIPFFIIITLINLWINGAIIDQAKYYKKRRSLIKSFEFSTSRYLSLFCATVLYAIIIGIVSSPPYIGSLLAFIFSLIFFYIFPAIIIDRRGCIDSFRLSWRAFKRYPLETFVTWLLIMIISLIIIGIFALPALFYLIGSLIEPFQAMEMATLNESVARGIIRSVIIPKFASYILSPYFIPYFFIFCIGLSIQKVFSVGTQARLYVNLKRRRV